MKIPLSRPDITQKDILSVLRVLRNPKLSLGPKINEFERKFCAYIGTRYAITVNSGTSGLHLCIKVLGIKDGDEVITTPFSFIASANCILFERAKPVFVDIDPDTLNIDTRKIRLKITKKTKAILPVHIFGYPCQMDEIRNIAKEFNLKVIEDACEALGAEFGGRKVGGFGTCGVFGFYPNKQITTGEGGIIVTNDKKIAYLCRSLRNQGRSDKVWLDYERLGFNYRISDINCALGISQLGKINIILRKRRKIAQFYNRRLCSVKEINLLCSDTKGSKRSWFNYVVKLDNSFTAPARNRIIDDLKNKGIECGAYFPSIHLVPFYTRYFGFREGDFPVSESISARTIALPFHNNLKERNINFVCENLINLLKRIKR